MLNINPIGYELHRQGDNDEGAVGWELTLMGLMLAKEKNEKLELGKIISLAIEKKRIVVLRCEELQYCEQNFRYCPVRGSCPKIDRHDSNDLLERVEDGCGDCEESSWVAICCILPDKGKNMGSELTFYLTSQDGKRLHDYLGKKSILPPHRGEFTFKK